MTPLQMYLLILITKLTGVGAVILGLGLFGIFISGAIWLGESMSHYQFEEPDIHIRILSSVAKAFKLSLLLMGIGGLLSFFAVDMKQLALIYGVPAVVNNEQARQVPENILNYVNTWLEENKEELENE